ncbi:ABC transporter permease [Methylobacterium nonmethylotrophicum]|uniref:ABC transporter permease n=1 Tax=Methylobacterium nonmethylotrophicum TaxID=1141884 RepID=A0A4Z0NJK9_9HYPH|nr:ABC transporter permease [Methylobacterium nonmethylotrophicum]TGD95892.1 ABC transporter permease [Methylobacterium nonmethylotrophicum]
MDPSFLVLQALSGLASASSLFVIASGLTIVFGVTRIVNFAHGSFYMLGAYIAVTLVPRLLDLSYSPAAFFLGVLLSALLVGLIGVAVEVLLLRRIYRVPELFQLLATFGVVLIVEDLVLKIWGPVDIAGPRAPSLRHGVEILGQRFPAYELVLIAVGPLVLGLLWLLMHRTRFGVLIRAATQDREMVGALGVNQARLFTLTLFLGASLAGLGGALQIPRIPANGHMDLSVITDAFVVTVIGGMGSVPGAFVAALLIGQLQAFGILIFPKVTLVLVFALMAVVLVVKPWGLFGRPEAASGRVMPPEGIPSLRRFRPAEAALAGLAVLALLAVPLFGDAYKVKVATEILIFALAAFSLQFLIGVGGLVSFGHAAYFGLGAYAAGLLVTGPFKAPMELALVAAPLAAGAGAALFGYFIVRLSGIYLAMLTLAFGQIVYAVCFQWVEVTGGDNGVVGVWPSSWASGRTTYFYLVAALSLTAIVLLRRVIYAPFGYTLRAARDSATRAEAIGLDVRTHRWLGFILAGAAAGLAGGLYAFMKGSIDPTLTGIPLSIDFLVMVLVGGIQTVMGPLVGAAFFHALKDAVMPLTEFWRLLLGLAIIATVLAFPRGLAGAAEALRGRVAAPKPVEASA